ncbi:hypothetical protein ACCE111639_14195 [Acinetobacter celticus]
MKIVKEQKTSLKAGFLLSNRFKRHSFYDLDLGL